MALQLVLAALEAKLKAQGVRRRTFEGADGRRLSYFEAGAPDAERTLVLVHGLGSSSLNWGRVIVPLARRARVLALDLPGFGKSPLPTGLAHLGIRAYAEALAEFLRSPAVGRPVVLAGQSLGGWIAVKAALAVPDRVAELVLVNTAGLRYEGIEELKTVLSPSSKDEVHATWKKIWHRTPWFYRPFWRASIQHMAAASVQGFMERVAEDDFLNDDLSRLRVPVTVLWGRADRLLPAATVDWILERVPGARVHWLARTGHVPQIESPKRFVRAINAVLAGASGRRPPGV